MPVNHTPEIGTLIAGTHRPEDLGPAFLDALRGYHFQAWMALPKPAEDDPAFWQTEEGTQLLDTLTFALEAVAPEGMVFGAHPDDGADIGFWPTDDDDED